MPAHGDPFLLDTKYNRRNFLRSTPKLILFGYYTAMQKNAGRSRSTLDQQDPKTLKWLPDVVKRNASLKTIYGGFFVLLALQLQPNSLNHQGGSKIWLQNAVCILEQFYHLWLLTCLLRPYIKYFELWHFLGAFGYVWCLGNYNIYIDI